MISKQLIKVIRIFQSHYFTLQVSVFKELISKPKINVSAGELLGRTHEELVLLLIQLRRQQAQTFQAIESCYNEIDTLQVCWSLL